ncbi:MAG: serine acetyltransferase [Phycisphaeraceae bacterium]|nr:serine acetyltransferase [Phycisphaeraceae bacterium]
MVDAILQSYRQLPSLHHLDATFLPHRGRTIDIIELVRRVVFPGFFDDQRLTSDTIRFHVGELVNCLRGQLYEQVRQALRHDANHQAQGRGDACDLCDHKAAKLTDDFLGRIPALRDVMASDVQAAFDGDPAAGSIDETIFCYPGVDATFIHRVAHELHVLGVPLLPRIMSEYAHNETGIDIHPGATIGRSFFIDHGTGVVIGETCVLGDHVKVYQGVTLGALSTKGGQSWRGRKRHPTIGNDVTLYGGAIILGDITIGEGCVIGGSVFLTKSVEPWHTVTMKTQELEIRPRPRKPQRNGDLDSPSA